MDVTESPQGRKKQKDYYSGKKKYHTIKKQIILNQKTKEILCIAQGKGHIHDFRLFKESMGQAIHRKIMLLADSGYQGRGCCKTKINMQCYESEKLAEHAIDSDFDHTN
ncbi:hypothetical protein ABE44_34420, partial [Bacillus thuringiensis]|nr:hypothetical protein [Bacillus thuringiensis]